MKVYKTEDGETLYETPDGKIIRDQQEAMAHDFGLYAEARAERFADAMLERGDITNAAQATRARNIVKDFLVFEDLDPPTQDIINYYRVTQKPALVSEHSLTSRQEKTHENTG